MEKETFEEAAENHYEEQSKEFENNTDNPIFNTSRYLVAGFIEGAKWQQEQDLNWFNEYQKVEDYIIEKIGDEFLKATPEKHKTASQSTIALLENNWQQERMYSEEEILNIVYKIYEEFNIYISKETVLIKIKKK